MKITSIASGSSGNCIHVGSDNINILIDVGISRKYVEEGLFANDINPQDISGILVTHEHSDHIRGIGVLSRKYDIPIYGTKETLDFIDNCKSLGRIDKDLFHEVEPDNAFQIGDMTTKPFSISHDALNPVAYRVENNGKALAVATDMGTFTDYTVNSLKNLDAILLEANHDVKMLQVGPYPYYLKRRILGKKGHLSNELSGRLLNQILNDNMKYIMLGHLSKENNFPELAYETVRMEIDMSDNKYNSNDFPIVVTKRDEALDTIEI